MRETIGYFFKGKEVCVSAVNEFDELVSNPYLQEKKLFIKQQINGTEFSHGEYACCLSSLSK
jgi:crotonobetainyl-CoA:carnitine CoA-transferase CaiB-like acyl-CoA transferase